MNLANSSFLAQDITEDDKPATKTWEAADDYQLKEGIQSRLVFQSMCKSGIWSVRWAASELQARWRDVLYDDTISAEAASNMWSTPHLGRKPRWSESETKVMEAAKSDSSENYIILFEQHREAWHPTRTLAQVEQRMRELKRALNREDGGKKGAKASAETSPPAKRSKRGEAASAAVPASAAPKPVTPQTALNKYPWNDNVDVIGILVGENTVFEIRETPALIGRKPVKPTADQELHVNLADEGDASTISRVQAVIDVDASYRYTVEQKGKATTSVNNRDLRDAGAIPLLPRAQLQFTNISLTWIPRPH